MLAHRLISSNAKLAYRLTSGWRLERTASLRGLRRPAITCQAIPHDSPLKLCPRSWLVEESPLRPRPQEAWPWPGFLRGVAQWPSQVVRRLLAVCCICLQTVGRLRVRAMPGFPGRCLARSAGGYRLILKPPDIVIALADNRLQIFNTMIQRFTQARAVHTKNPVYLFGEGISSNQNA